MIRHALARPVSTLIAAATLVTVGVFSLYHLPISFLPEIQRPRLELTLRAEGRSQEELLHGLTIPLERRLAAAAGVLSVRSDTGDEIARILLEADWQADPERLLMDVSRRVEYGGDFIPDEKTLILQETESSPLVEVAVLGGESAAARTSFIRQVLLPDLARVQGTGHIETIGLMPLHVVVRPYSAALAARGITAVDVIERLRSVGAPVSAGLVQAGAEVHPMVVLDRIESVEDLGRVRVSTPGGPAFLRDLAQISLEEISDGTSFALDGEQGALIRIYRAPGANAVALSQRLRYRVEELQHRATGEPRLEIVTDRSRDVVSALYGMGLAAFSGMLLGTLMLRFMLGTMRPTFALAVVIPASILTSFSAFHFWGVPLNVISIAGLALASGMLVDNSIIVLESIESARARGDNNPRLAGTRQIAPAVVASTVTTIVVFLPLLYLRGLPRAFFGEQAFAIVSALAASLIFSLTLTPVLTSRRKVAIHQRSPGLAFFRVLFNLAMNRPAFILLGGGVLIAASLTSALLLPRALFPASREPVLRVTYQLPPQLGPEKAEGLAISVETTVRRIAQRQSVGSIFAIREYPLENPNTGLWTRRSPGGTIDIELRDTLVIDNLRDELERAVTSLPDIHARVEPRPSAFLESAGGWNAGLEILVTAPDERRVEALVERVSERVAQTTGVRPSAGETNEQLPVLTINWDELRLAKLGLAMPPLEAQLKASLRRTIAGFVSITDVSPEILVDGNLPRNLGLVPVGPVTTDIANANVARQARAPTIRSNESRVVPLRSLAGFEAGVRPAMAYRENGRAAQRLVVDEATAAAGLDALSLSRLLAEVDVAADESVGVVGEALDVQRSFGQLGLALGLSLLLVFLTLAAVYESLVLPLLIMTTVPAAAGGAMTALALSGQSLNLMSFMGLILLGGIVVNNAIVLLYRVEQLRRAGVAELAALKTAAAERYRPIIMTTATTMIAMLPLALLGGEGVELRRALATAVLGGLVTATFASLFLVPALHLLIERFRRTDSTTADSGVSV